MNSSKNFGRKALFLAISAMALSAGNVFADTATDNLDVSATVIENCLISTSALAFGDYDPVDVNLDADLEGTGTVSVTCTMGDVVQITLGQGANDATGTSGAPARRMKNGVANFLSYDLFSDDGHLAVWADSTADVETTGDGEIEEHIVYGLVEMGQNVPAGVYTDVVVATVTF